MYVEGGKVARFVCQKARSGHYGMEGRGTQAEGPVEHLLCSFRREKVVTSALGSVRWGWRGVDAV